MFLITSGAYISGEFASEIGMLPPSFLPLGNRCLYEHQVELAESIDNAQVVCLSIPDSFVLSDAEQAYIARHNVTLIRVPEHISLGDSILYCLNMLPLAEEPLHVLHGDTLYKSLPAGHDIVSVSPNTGYYNRAKMPVSGNEASKTACLIEETMAVDGDVVVSGYFAFSSARCLIRSLAKMRGRFIDALNDYHQSNRLNAVLVNDWYDFGHINSYFNSRASFTTERSFNALKIDAQVVRKASTQQEKMIGEANWFKQLPGALQLFTPKILIPASTHQRAEYGLEYIYNLPLNDLFVFGRLAKEIWRSIFASCYDFMQRCQQASDNGFRVDKSVLDVAALNALYLPKTQARLLQLQSQSFCDVSKPVRVNGAECPSPLDLAKLTAALIPVAAEQDIAIVHGDFCFSNILYDFRTRRIKVIDPRGIDTEGKPALLGDRRYDLAKLYHSVFGLYDLIIAGRFEAVVEEDGSLILRDNESASHTAIAMAFDEVFFNGSVDVSKKTIQAITIHLFLSMLPLHSDRPDRQWTMLANAYRLYRQLIESDSCL